ncbi:MAG: NAD(P)/FAD-dependent oxidoreductase [Anaerolineae bacterium]|nr:NAD(P)/FAD-dependent oxidoreductase [Anaerolineae bacterium]
MGAYKVVIIGAGLGGLSAAAYLAKAGLRPLVIEQTSFPGGRCYARKIDGVEYDIGAIYIGERAPRILQGVFGIDCAFKPYRIGIRTGSDFVSFPFDRQTLQELRRCKTSWVDILRFLIKVPMLFRSSYFDRYRSVGEVLDSLTEDKNIRRFWDVMFGVLGVSPYRLPSHYLGMGRSAIGTVVGNPVQLSGGNKQVADLLVDFIRQHGGQLVFGEKVEQIMLKDARACSVETNRGKYTADFVVSNADIKTTILTMTGRDIWDETYLQEVEALKKTLQVVNIFLTISPLQKFCPDFGVFFVAEEMAKGFQSLEEGRFPDGLMFILQVPSNLENSPSQCHRATLQFYHPRGSVTPEVLEQQVHRVMTEGLERLFPGLSDRVVNYTVFDPTRYEQEFGLKPFVYGLSPDLNYRRFPVQTPVSNLFCVGDSVQPERPSVPQAMESGILCAQEIIRQVF